MKSFFRHPNLKHAIFWSWNFIFVSIILFLEFNSQFLFGIIKNSVVGYTPLGYLFYALSIYIVPIGCILFASKKLLKQPEKIMRLFYGVEIPLFILFISRIGLFREMIPATSHIYILLFIGIVSFLSELIIDSNKTPKWLQTFQKVGHTILLLIGLYVSVILLFFFIPFIGYFFQGVASISWADIQSINLKDILNSFLMSIGWGLLFIIFFGYTITLFGFLPIALMKLYFGAFKRMFAVKIPYGNAIIISTIVINLLLFWGLNTKQTQVDAFELLEKDFSLAENRAIFHENEDEIKEGLLNAYLNKYRYIGSVERSNSIQELYHGGFDMERENAKGIQTAFNFLMKPFLYQGSSYRDANTADELYAQFFDGNIQKQETEPIKKALKANYDSDGIEAGLLNINEEKVLITHQNIEITQNDDIATVEIHEVYQNQTFSQQEIFYYFSLPENAVFTGMWLSDNDSIPKKYEYKVSPRGAAQKVYKEEVRRRVDPSLLEQVGPNQYRLRAFPIDPKQKQWNDDGYVRTNWNDYTIEYGDNFHLWIAYQTIINNQSEWELPTLLERRNVYWDVSTSLTINGKTANRNENWLPKLIASENKVNRKSHTAQLSDSLRITLAPKNIELTTSFKNQSIAIVIDASYSMQKYQDELKVLLTEFKNKDLNQEKTSVYLINNEVQQFKFNQFEQFIGDEAQPFFGTTTNIEMIEQYSTIAKNESIDAIVLITDKGNYEASSDSIKSILLEAPLFIKHLSNEITPIYNDHFWETIQNSKGNIISDLDDLLMKLQIKNDSTIWAYKSGIRYQIEKDSAKHTFAEGSHLAAKVVIENWMIPTDSNRNNVLDKIHQIALQQGIVTPFSSMIVLVNDRQKKALEEAEAAEDRFDREVESGNESLTNPPDLMNVNGTPEPHEWVLIILVVLLLYYRYYHQKKIA
jgi:putative PEP-CTERM system integral membrane protein